MTPSQNNNWQNRYPSHQQGRRPIPEKRLPEGYLKGGYFEETQDNVSKKMKKDLILQTAEDIANDIASDRNSIKKSQLRKYYNYCKGIENKLKMKNGFFEMVEIDIFSLKKYVADAYGKKNVPKLFYDFIGVNLEHIKSVEDFKAFLKHFEAIVAYYPKEN